MLSAAQGSAPEQATTAFLHQTKIDEKADAFSRRLVTDQTRKHLGNLALIVKAAAERRVQFSWEVP